MILGTGNQAYGKYPRLIYLIENWYSFETYINNNNSIGDKFS